MRQKRRDAADGAGHAFDVASETLPSVDGVELEDLRNAKAFLEAVPDVGPAARCRSTAASGDPSRAGAARCAARYRHNSPMYWNSVQSQRTTSLQNRRAENVSRITTEPPPTRTAPGASTPPTL